MSPCRTGLAKFDRWYDIDEEPAYANIEQMADATSYRQMALRVHEGGRNNAKDFADDISQVMAEDNGRDTRAIIAVTKSGKDLARQVFRTFGRVQKRPKIQLRRAPLTSLLMTRKLVDSVLKAIGSHVALAGPPKSTDLLLEAKISAAPQHFLR